MNASDDGSLARLQAFHDLWQLACRYAVALDDGDYTTIENLFADDAEFIFLDRSTHKGNTTIAAYLRQRGGTELRERVHTPTSLTLGELTAESATGLVLSFAALSYRNREDSFIAFRYSDNYVKKNDLWKFERRRLHGAKSISTRALGTQ